MVNDVPSKSVLISETENELASCNSPMSLSLAHIIMTWQSTKYIHFYGHLPTKVS